MIAHCPPPRVRALRRVFAGALLALVIAQSIGSVREGAISRMAPLVTECAHHPAVRAAQRPSRPTARISAVSRGGGMFVMYLAGKCMRPGLRAAGCGRGRGPCSAGAASTPSPASLHDLAGRSAGPRSSVLGESPGAVAFVGVSARASWGHAGRAALAGHARGF
jgi:hypothetical protein